MAESKGACAGFIIGLLMIPGSIALHSWNEYRTIHRTHGLKEAQREVVSVDSGQVATDQNGNLVHLAGQSHTDEILTDDEFGISERAVHLRRNVEMFQWDEDESGKDGSKSYSYRLDWHEGRINSESFHQPVGHENPNPRFQSKTVSANKVNVGAYRLNDRLRDQMDDWEDIKLPDSVIAEAMPDQSQNFTVRDNLVYWSSEAPNPTEPKIGDLRIRFEHVTPGQVSLVAKLAGDTFETHRTSNGEPIERLYDGILTSDDVFAYLRTENTAIAWGIRVGGLLLCVIGVFLLFGPIQKLFSWIPVVGNVTNNLFFVAALLIGSSISLVTISIAWIAVRPVLGIILIVVAVLAFVLLSKLGGKSEDEMPDSDVTVVTDDMLV